jgi:CO dehydrogenase/acetyl-CoA synthase beta subunit
MPDTADLQQKDYYELIRVVHELAQENEFTSHPLGDAKICNDLGLNSSGTRNACIVLEEDTAVELGAPDKDSLSFTMWTSRRGTLSNRLLTCGTDFDRLMNKSVSYVQIIMLEFEDGSQAVEPDIGRIKNLTNKLSGFMTRSMLGKTWIRIGKERMNQGFSLYALGQCLHKAYRDAIPDIKSMEIILITGHDEIIKILKPVSEAAKIISGGNTKFKWVSDGVVSCDELDCDNCDDKATCDSINEMLAKRKAMKKNN